MANKNNSSFSLKERVTEACINRASSIQCRHYCQFIEKLCLEGWNSIEMGIYFPDKYKPKQKKFLRSLLFPSKKKKKKKHNGKQYLSPSSICLYLYRHVHTHLPYFVSIQSQFKRSND